MRCAQVRNDAAVIIVTRVVIPLVTQGALESDKGERVAKTIVWDVIKRNRERLQGFEDKLKEREKENG